MATLPATGSAIKMGSVYRAYTNTPPGTSGNASRSPGPYPGGQNITLSNILGSQRSVSQGTVIKFSETFGSQTTPYNYT